MVKELIFHLGDRKTGSTAIQDALARKDITGPNGDAIFYSTRTNHIPLAKTLSMVALSGQRKGRFSKIARQIAKSDADVAVISAEHFEVVDPSVLKDAIGTYFPDLQTKVRLIAYVRPHAERLVSNYAEQIKLGQFNGTLEAYHTNRLAEKPLEYADRFGLWRDVFGDAFTLRPFVRKMLHGEDIVADFAQYVFGDAPHTVSQSPQSNPSMSLEDLSMVRLLQDQLGAVPGISGFQVATGKKLGQLLAEENHVTGTKLALHKSLAKKIKTDYLADARALDRAFFAPNTLMEEALQKACDTALDTAQSIDVADHLSAETIRAVHVWAGVLRDLVETTGPDKVRKTLKAGPKNAGKKGKLRKGRKGKKGLKGRKKLRAKT